MLRLPSHSERARASAASGASHPFGPVDQVRRASLGIGGAGKPVCDQPECASEARQERCTVAYVKISRSDPRKDY